MHGFEPRRRPARALGWGVRFGAAAVLAGVSACAEVIESKDDAADALVGLVGVDVEGFPDMWRPSPALDASGVSQDAARESPDDVSVTPDVPGSEPPTVPPTDAPTEPPTAPPTDAPTTLPTEPPTAPGMETCNGLDDDEDGVVDDDAACGVFIEQRCRLWIGWADERRGPAGASESWGDCPPEDRAGSDDVRCNSTRGDGRFALLDFNGNVNDDDQVGLALRCDADADGVGAWIQSRCRVFLGQADDNRGPADGSLTWGGCPDDPGAVPGALPCTSTGGDGRFRALNFTGDVDDDDDLGIAWLCKDAADPRRAEVLTSAVEVFVGWADDNLAPRDQSEVWGTCPGAPEPARGEVRCTSSGGDGRFHLLHLGGQVDGNDGLGFALRARGRR